MAQHPEQFVWPWDGRRGWEVECSAAEQVLNIYVKTRKDSSKTTPTENKDKNAINSGPARGTRQLSAVPTVH